MRRLLLCSVALGMFASPVLATPTKVDLANQVQGALPVTNGGTGTTSATGSGAVVLGTAPTISSPTISGIKVAAGTATLAPVTLTAGTNLTTAAAGSYEFDGTAFYDTAATGTRQVVPAEQWAVLSAAYTLTSQTAAQKLFNDSTNGAFTLPIGTYETECRFSLTSMSTTSGSFGFAWGGAATFTQSWTGQAVVAAAATATSEQSTFNTAANTTLATAGTAGAGRAMIKGILRVTVAGTVIPEVSLTVAAAAVVGANSYCRIGALGSATFTSIGNRS